uniref:Uncharacterized protein n=1 Tax=Anopheles maculatus TaxID=74869 RepID=A0A182SMP0_9DIPT
MKVDTNVSTSQMEQNWTRYMVMCDRKDIRQPVNFQEENEVQATLVGNKALAKQYEIENPVDRGTQSTRWILNTPVWTVHNRLVHTGITHVEGGWPKDIDCWRDEELMTRYRRKQEKSEAYVQQMRGLTRYILLNLPPVAESEECLKTDDILEAGNRYRAKLVFWN